MTQNEFHELIGASVHIETFETVTLVYNFHPAIPDVGGKEVIANLYKIGGFGLIRDMVPSALKNRDLETELRNAEEEIRIANEKKLAILNNLRGLKNSFRIPEAE